VANDVLFFDLKKIEFLSHYPMVTELAWLKSVLKFISFFLPRISFRFFVLKDKDVALGWLKK